MLEAVRHKANDFSRQSLDFGFSPPPTPTAIKPCMFGMQNMDPVDENSNTDIAHKNRNHCGSRNQVLRSTLNT